MSVASVHEEAERAKATFHALFELATAADLRAPTSGTRWTNGHLLFHILLGYGVVRSLLPLVRTLGRQPGPCRCPQRRHQTVPHAGRLTGETDRCCQIAGLRPPCGPRPMRSDSAASPQNMTGPSWRS